ncbi:MAG: GNAT family N-acetyltransferase [Clostridia bacterium]|nr:GNAT family N-acetyltransferase [Clostridia bacterium]
MKFKEFELSDIEKLSPLITNKISPSCENTLLNLAVWYPSYNPLFYVDGKDVYIRIDDKNGPVFSLMLCSDVEKSVNKICEYCAKENIIPQFLLEDDKVLNEFNDKFGSEYFIYEVRDAAEYIYKQSDLAELSGKKYHSKRNHISAFTKKFNWQYEDLSDINKEDFLMMSDEWYADNPQKVNAETMVERNGIHFLVQNMSKFSVSGGLIRIDGKVVAITLGAAINENVFDVMFEKAFSDYPGAYAVINREFARRIKHELINREEDLGIEGLRKAKLSYKPHQLLRKYIAVPISIYNSSKKLHMDTFKGETENSTNGLLSRFFKDCFFIQKDGEIISQLFVISATLNDNSVGYIYAAATKPEFRSKGLMRSLIEKAKEYYDVLALKPAEQSLYNYYEKLGFTTAFYNNEITEIKGNNTIEIKKIKDIDEFIAVRNLLLPENSLNLCDEALEYVLEQYEVYTDKGDLKQNLAVFYVEDGVVNIRELLSDENRDVFVASILKLTNCNKLSALVPSESFGLRSGMIYPSDNGVNYLGLALD